MPLSQLPFGPFLKGVVDRAQSSQALTGIARKLNGWRFSGANKLSIRPGTRVVLTLLDGGGDPVTDVCAIVPFTDGALAVGHSTNTNTAYLYRLPATMDGYIDSGGTLHAGVTASPVGTLWTSIPDPPEVTIAEGLGVAYIAHAAAMDAASLSFAMQSFDDATRTIAPVTSDLDSDTSAEPLYFRGCISFQQHLWAWSFGTGTVAADAFRPELARFSKPNFSTSGPPTPGDLFSPSDSITLGNRVRSLREGIIAGFVAGEALYLGSPYLISRITGYGRSSWDRRPLEDSYGFVGQKCGVTAGSTLYYWSPRGPMRIAPMSDPEPLFDAVQSLVDRVVNPQTVVAGFDQLTDTVLFTVDTGAGVRVTCAFDVRRDVWADSDDDIGVTIRSAGSVTPIYAVTAAATLGPLGAPTSASTTNIGATTATANWLAGDATSPTQVELRQQGATTWNVMATVSAGVSSYTFSGLTADVDYEWRAAHVKDGQTSTYLGPTTDTQFTTVTTLDGLLPPTGLSVVATDDSGAALDQFTDHAVLRLQWTNSGEAGVSTVIEMAQDTGSYGVQQTAGVGVSSASITVFTSATYHVRVSHTKPGYTGSVATAPVDVSVSIS